MELPVEKVPKWFRNAELAYPLSGDDLRRYLKENDLVPPTLLRGPGVGKQKEIERYHDLGVKVISYIVRETAEEPCRGSASELVAR